MSELKTNLDEILQEKQNKIIPENIKKDIQIFGVVGTYEGSGGGIDTSSDNPITADDVAQGKEGFVNGEKVIGNAFTVESGGSAVAIDSPYTYKIGPVGQLQIYGQPPVWSGGQTSTLFKQGSQTFISILKEDQPDLANAIGLTSDKLVSGNTILGIEGTATGEVKLFETEEEMQADSSAQEEDLAVVYREEIQNMTSDTQTQYITFPETVTLPTAQGGAIARGYLIATDGGSFMDQATYNLTSSTFSFNMYASSGMIQVQYESTDGITYTRTLFDTLENPVDLGTMMTPDGALPDNCGYFMQIGGNIFKGLFECHNILNPDTVSAYKFYKYIEENGERIPDKEDTEFTKEEVTLFKESMENSNFDSFVAVLIKNLDTEEYYVASPNAAVLLTSEKAYICGIPPRNDEESVDFNSSLYKVNTITKTLEQLDTVSSITAIQGDDCWFGCPLPNMNKIQISKVDYPKFKESDVRYYANNSQFVDIDLPLRTNVLKYEFAPSQLNATKDSVYNSTYYGKDGIEEGTLTQNVSNSFTDINADVYSKIQQAYDNMQPRILTDSDKKIDKNIYVIPIKSDGTPLLDTSQVTDMYIMFVSCTNLQSIPLLDTSKVTNMRGMFNGCTNLTTISLLNTSQVTHTGNMFSNCTSLTNIPLLDTSNVTTMYSMFSDCTNLQSVPLLDTSNVTTMNGMFSNCENLSNESLNNILQMCINAIKVTTSNKTLKFIGLSETQAQTCTTLSNYSAFTAAGWTTGY